LREKGVKMTTVYFIRHAESDNSIRDGRLRPLTEKGLTDRKLVTDFLWDKNVDVMVSSPFKRSIDTIADFAEKKGLEIELYEDFRERKSDIDMIVLSREEFLAYMQQQWSDFNYTQSVGECLAEVQKRNIDALNQVLEKYQGKTIVVGTHGTALSTIINFYENTYGYEDFMAMVYIMPWVVKMVFDGKECLGIERCLLPAS